jgi:branched-subunit amino acid aminotransferase/4-amino-4-deoxychorismate lyase
MDGAFITGTSSKVLPIVKIGDHSFSSIPSTTRIIMELYDRMVEASL